MCYLVCPKILLRGIMTATWDQHCRMTHCFRSVCGVPPDADCTAAWRPAPLHSALPCVPFAFADIEELYGLGADTEAPDPESAAALLHRAQCAEERAGRTEQALSRALEDLHKLKSVCRHLLSQCSCSSAAQFRKAAPSLMASVFIHLWRLEMCRGTLQAKVNICKMYALLWFLIMGQTVTRIRFTVICFSLKVYYVIARQKFVFWELRSLWTLWALFCSLVIFIIVIPIIYCFFCLYVSIAVVQLTNVN